MCKWHCFLYFKQQLIQGIERIRNLIRILLFKNTFLLAKTKAGHNFAKFAIIKRVI